MSKLGCSTRIGIPLVIVVAVLFIVGGISGPIGQSLFDETLPDSILPDKPLSGVKVEELEEGAAIPEDLTAISFEEMVRLGKDKNVNIVIIDGEELAVSLKGKDDEIVNVVTLDGTSIDIDPAVQKDAVLLVTLHEEISEHELVEKLREEDIKIKESSPLAPEGLFKLFGDFAITNTILATWLTIIVLVALAYFATRKMKEIPSGLQNVMEAIVEVMLGFIEGVAGKENGRRFFVVVGSIFLFVLVNAWLSLFPIFNSITYNGMVMFRGANTDINVPLAIALVSFVMVEYWGITSLGFGVYMKKFVRLENLRQGKVIMGAVDIFVGVLEGISEFIRILSFTFRLFGNMTAGEILLLVTSFLIPFVFSTVFYGLELFIGLIQALIFAGLTLVFAHTAVASHDHEEGHAEVKHDE